MSNSCSQLSTQGSREGARQRRERRGASAVGLGSWSAFSCPSALIWYHERRAVAHVSQDPSPRPHSVSFLHSRPSPCCEFLKKVNFIGKVVFICLVGSVNSVSKILGQPGETRFQPGGDEISSGVPMSFNTKLTEPKGK